MKKIQLDVPFGMMLLGACFFTGGLLGFLFASLLTQDGNLPDYFISFFSAVEAGEWSPDFWNSLWCNFKTPLLVFLLGFSFLGTSCLPMLFISEGFLFTFSISSLCRWLGYSGLVPAFFLFCLSALLWIPILFVLGLQSYYTSLSLGKKGKKEETFPAGYVIRTALCFFFLFFCVLFELILLPTILESIITYRFPV